nr:sugar-binding domain-containing protein [Bacillus inaquosorum]
MSSETFVIISSMQMADHLSVHGMRVIALELDQLREIPLVIGVACGLEKVKAIKAALEGKLVHVLVTDEQTAQALLD